MAESTDPRALRDAIRQLILAQGTLNAATRPCGTPMPTEHAWALMELESPITVTELSARLGIDRTNVSRLCARLEAAGEVERVPHPQDARAKLVKLTDEGRRVAHALDNSSAEFFEKVARELEREVVDVLKSTAEAIERVKEER